MRRGLFWGKVLSVLTMLTASLFCQAAAPADTAAVVLGNIASRTSVRNFTDKPVEKSKLDAVVRAAMAAPSAVNKQPWAFVVITERQVLDSLEAVHPHANLKTATAAVVICGDMSRALPGPAREYWVQDCSAATENMLLAAHALGLGAVWCGVYPDKKRVADVARVLGLPADVLPLNVVTMGYPATIPKPKNKWNPGNVHYQKW